MWWTGQNLDKPVADKTGHEWYFRVWHDFLDGEYIQRIFFWNEDRSVTGMFEVRGDQTLHVRKIRQRVAKLAKDPGYRWRFRKPLSFPVERHFA